MGAAISRVASVAEFEAVLALPRAAMFLWVPWSGPCRCREMLALKALAASPELPQLLHRVDFEADDALQERVRIWIAPVEPAADDWIMAGTGVLLFVQKGRIAAVFGHSKWGPPARIAEQAAEAFQEAGPF